MLGSGPAEALRRFVDTQNEALNCVTVGRLVALDRQHAGSVLQYTVRPARIDDRDDPMRFRLRGPEPVLLEIRQVVSVPPAAHSEGTVALIASYGYRLLVDRNGRPQEIMVFHWTPDAPPPQRRFPHLHVGSLVTSASPFRGADFHKLHIPTGHLSLETVLLFAIEEVGVEPAQGRDRAAVLSLLREGDRLASQGNAGFDR